MKAFLKKTIEFIDTLLMLIAFAGIFLIVFVIVARLWY